MKNVLIISSSPRVKSNSDSLCKYFEKGALEQGHKVDYIRLKDKKINYCLACRYCEQTEKCFQKDDMQNLIDLVLSANVIVFATPVYYYCMSAQLKTFIDRLTPIYTKVRADIYIFATAWDPDEKNLLSTIESIRGCTRDCFENCPEKGVIVVENVHGKNTIEGNPKLNEAYLMGKNC